MSESLARNRVFVGGISWKADEASLANFFSSFGVVTECKIIMDRNTGKSKGYGFVTFQESDAADRVKQTANFYFLGKNMNVGDAVRKSESSESLGSSGGGSSPPHSANNSGPPTPTGTSPPSPNLGAHMPNGTNGSGGNHHRRNQGYQQQYQYYYARQGEYAPQYYVQYAPTYPQQPYYAGYVPQGFIPAGAVQYQYAPVTYDFIPAYQPLHQNQQETQQQHEQQPQQQQQQTQDNPPQQQQAQQQPASSPISAAPQATAVVAAESC